MHVGRWFTTRAGRMARLYPDGGLAASAGADGWRVYDADGAYMAAGFESGTDAADEALEAIGVRLAPPAPVAVQLGGVVMRRSDVLGVLAVGDACSDVLLLDGRTVRVRETATAVLAALRGVA